MPNWCTNNLIVEGYDYLIDEFVDKNFEDGELVFSKAVPEPKFEDPKQQQEYDKEGWYDWRRENWGTKWEPNYVSHEIEDIGSDIATPKKRLKIEFETPWCPPMIWYAEVVGQHKKLFFELEYYEIGAEIEGRATGIEGIVENYDWDMTNERIAEIMGDTEYIGTDTEGEQTNEGEGSN